MRIDVGLWYFVLRKLWSYKIKGLRLSGCKDTWIRKLEFEINSNIFFFHLYYYSYTPGGSSEYLAVLDETLPHLLDTLRPDLVLYDAGVDPHVKDDLGIVIVGGVGVFNVFDIDMFSILLLK